MVWRRVIGNSIVWVAPLHVVTDDNTHNGNRFQKNIGAPSWTDAVEMSERFLFFRRGYYNAKGSFGQEEPILHLLESGRTLWDFVKITTAEK